MSVEHLAAALHHSRAKGTAKLVLLGIANHAGDGGAWPSVATLARYANVTTRNVTKALASLQSLGEIRIHYQAGGLADMADHRRPNRYDVLVSCPPWCDKTPNHRDTRPSAGPQATLWINPPSQSTPPVGIDTPPLSHATGVPLSESTPKPSVEPSDNANASGPALTTDRARVTNPEFLAATSGPPRVCDQCTLTEHECRRRAATSGHVFQPRSTVDA